MEVVVQFKLLLWIFLTAFLLMPLFQGKDFRYCSNRGFPVKITGVTVYPDPVFRGKVITYTIYASTDQVIFGGEMVIDISYYSFHIHSKKHNLCDETSCPISIGDFGLSLFQVLPEYAAPGSYNIQMKLLGKDGRQLSCVVFDFTVRYPQLRVSAEIPKRWIHLLCIPVTRASNQNYQVQVTRATVTLEPVFGGKLITFNLSAFTDQAIFEGEVVIDLSFKGVHFHSEKYVLCVDLSCPISEGNFAYSFSQVLSVNVARGNYNFMMRLLSKDGRRLSCVAFDFTIPYQVTFTVPYWHLPYQANFSDS